MIQNVITLIIVFSAIAFVIFSVIKNMTHKKASGCDGCAGCGLKEIAGNSRTMEC